MSPSSCALFACEPLSSASATDVWRLRGPCRRLRGAGARQAWFLRRQTGSVARVVFVAPGRPALWRWRRVAKAGVAVARTEPWGHRRGPRGERGRHRIALGAASRLSGVEPVHPRLAKPPGMERRMGTSVGRRSLRAGRSGSRSGRPLSPGRAAQRHLPSGYRDGSAFAFSRESLASGPPVAHAGRRVRTGTAPVHRDGVSADRCGAVGARGAPASRHRQAEKGRTRGRGTRDG